MSTKALTMLLEEGAVANALRTAFVCKHCNSGKITIAQHPELCKGFCTYPTQVCEDCKASTPIVSSCAGDSSFETFCCLGGLYLKPTKL